MFKIKYSLEESIQKFLSSLSEGTSNYEYRNALSGNTENGLNLRLGYSCYALKIYYTIGLWEKLDNISKTQWAEYIQSFQKSILTFPKNSYVDEALINGYKNFSKYKKVKNFSKSSLNFLNLYSYEGVKKQLTNSVKAESKQAIATLYEIGFQSKKKYTEFEQDENEINNFLESQDWKKPWSAGAQFANLCVFSMTQLENNQFQSKLLSEKIIDYVDTDSGFYFLSKKPSNSELINGSMKVLSGLDWIGTPIHYPEKIIDYCLNARPNNDGCDLVDIVYVLYQASQQTSYRKSEIVKYVDSLCEIIFLHYYPEEGGFSYFKNKSQMYYYGLQTSKGQNVPDIHGTILLTWALSMIFRITENDKFNWNVLKP